jgi:hypothetical protein
MIVDGDDTDSNYDRAYTRYIKYIFDDYYYGGESPAADGKTYIVPDINKAGVEYDFLDMGGDPDADYFPFVKLTDKLKRSVLIEDDKKYWEHSHRREDKITKSIGTFNIGTDDYSWLDTKFLTNSHWWGSSDDLIVRSGIRGIDFRNTGGTISGYYKTISHDGYVAKIRKIYRP